MWECLVILSLHNDCFCFCGDECVMDHPLADFSLTPHPVDLCTEEVPWGESAQYVHGLSNAYQLQWKTLKKCSSEDWIYATCAGVRRGFNRHFSMKFLLSNLCFSNASPQLIRSILMSHTLVICGNVNWYAWTAGLWDRSDIWWSDLNRQLSVFYSSTFFCCCF